VTSEQYGWDFRKMYLIALRMLLGDTTKFLALVFGLTFSTTLIVQQGSIFTGILRRAGASIEAIPQADIWVMHPASKYYDARRPIEDTALQRVQGIEGVEWAQRLFIGSGSAQLPDGAYAPVTIVGVERVSKLGLPLDITDAEPGAIEFPEAVLFDDTGIGAYDHIKPGDLLQINERRARVVGLASAPRTFAGSPTIYTTYERALEYSPGERKRLTYVLTQTGLGAKTASDFFWETVFFFIRNTGIALNFAVTVSLGLIVGIAVSGQTFYTFTAENIKHFASLKAMGVRKQSLIKMVLLQATVVGLIGWGIGSGAAAIYGVNMNPRSVLAFLLTPQLLAISMITTLATVLLAAVISIRRVLNVEAAIVFR
jgi:putative ABC transport system permease protein